MELPATGAFGSYQQFVLLLGFLGSFPLTWLKAMPTFLLRDVDHWCSRPISGQYDNLTADEWKDLAVPLEQDTMDNTTRFSQCLGYGILTKPHLAEAMLGNETLLCSTWEYADPLNRLTLVEEFDLVCDRDYLKDVIYSTIFGGCLLGAFLFGQLSDAIGRRKTMLLSSILFLGCGLLASFAFSAVWYIIVIALVASSAGGFLVSFTVLCVETLPRHSRFFLPAAIPLGSVVALVSWTALLHGVQVWMYLQLATSLAMSIILPFFIILQESHRWLAVKGRKTRSKSALMSMIKMNGFIPESDFTNEDLQSTALDREKRCCSLLMLLFTQNTFFVYLRLIILSMMAYFCYFTSKSAVPEIVNHSLWKEVFPVSLGGLGFVFGMICLYGSRRRISLALHFVLAGACSISFPFLPEKPLELSFASSVLTYFVLSSAAMILLVFALEIIPTCARGVGFGMWILLCEATAFVVPYLSQAETSIHPDASHLIVGSFCILCAMLVFILPEGYDKELPDTYEDTGNKPKKCTEQIPLVERPETSTVASTS